LKLGISIGTVLLLFIAFYFVVKWAVKNGINESMLFTDEDRKRKYEEDLKKSLGIEDQ